MHWLKNELWLLFYKKKIYRQQFALYCFALLLLIPINVTAAQLYSVNILGIEDRLYDNVVSSLNIYQKIGEEGLSSRQIKRLHKNAEKEIREGLEPFGYYSVEIRAELVEEESGWRATYTVDAGEPVTVSVINILLDTKDEIDAEVQDIVDSFPLKKGNDLYHPTYNTGKKRLLKQLFALGYIKAEYTKSDILVHPAEGHAEINLRIKTGPRFLFGKTIFEQELLDPDLLTKYLNYTEGEPYSLKKLLKLQQTLYRTNFFGKVVVLGDINNAEGIHIPVVIRLSEPDYFNRYSFGFGYATDDGLRAILGWDNKLFNRHGHSVSAGIKLAERETELEFIYGVPVYDPRYDKVLLGATFSDESWEDTDTQYLRGGLSFEHAGTRFKYTGGIELRNEKYQIGDTNGDGFFPMPHLGWSIAYGDDLINTTHGLFVSMKMKGASEDAFADTTFIQAIVSGKLITTPIEGLRVIGKGSIGATSVETFDNLPPSLRFYAGGDQSVRGYDFNELGSTDEAGTVIGGKYLIFGSIEAEKLINENWSLATFIDVGKGINDFSEDLSKGVGAGIRYRLPFGQIRLDVASALSKEDQPLRLHITVGGDL